jgi:hypothetical protein
MPYRFKTPRRGSEVRRNSDFYWRTTNRGRQWHEGLSGLLPIRRAYPRHLALSFALVPNRSDHDIWRQAAKPSSIRGRWKELACPMASNRTFFWSTGNVGLHHAFHQSSLPSLCPLTSRASPSRGLAQRPMTAWQIKATSMLLQVLASSIPPDTRAKSNFGLLARLKSDRRLASIVNHRNTPVRWTDVGQVKSKFKPSI